MVARIQQGGVYPLFKPDTQHNPRGSQAAFVKIVQYIEYIEKQEDIIAP